MRPWKNPHEHFEASISRSARRYAEGLHQRGISPSPALRRAIAARMVQEAKESYLHEMDGTLHHNIDVILEQHRQRENVIKREGARLRLIWCPLIALCFGGMAWYSYTHGHMDLVVLYTFAALAFLAMLVLGAIFDRPR